MNFKAPILLLCICVICFTWMGCKSRKGGPSLEEHYNYKSTDPFGTKLAYDMLQYNFGKHYFEISDEPISEASNWWSESGSLYINISNNFYVDKKSAGHLLEFVSGGNTAFISANTIDENLLSQLYIEQRPNNLNRLFKSEMMEDTEVSLRLADSIPEQRYGYFYQPFSNAFINNENTVYIDLGYSGTERLPNLVILYWGQGKFILHLEPRALSNYFLLSQNNDAYVSSLMRIFPIAPDQIYWDDYYRKVNYRTNSNDSFSTLGTILRYPPLKWAFFASLFLLLLYILINGKRRQRIVPVLPKNTNASIAFTEAVAGLYLKENDNKAIAEKMIQFFNEGIRSRYFINSNQINDQFLETIHKKSGVDIHHVKELYNYIQFINNTHTVADEELLRLNELFQYFYKNKKG